MIVKRNKDLTEIFNENWKANHNDDVKIAREKEKEFWNKMFDVNSSGGNVVGNMQRDFDNLNKNINSNNEIRRQNRINNLRGKM